MPSDDLTSPVPTRGQSRAELLAAMASPASQGHEPDPAVRMALAKRRLALEERDRGAEAEARLARVQQHLDDAVSDEDLAARAALGSDTNWSPGWPPPQSYGTATADTVPDAAALDTISPESTRMGTPEAGLMPGEVPEGARPDSPEQARADQGRSAGTESKTPPPPATKPEAKK